MKKEKRALRIWLGIFAIILAVGIYTGGIRFQIGKEPEAKLVATEQRINQLNGIQNITGELLISPGSFTHYQQILGSTHQRLWMEMYDITQKDFYPPLKTLAQHGVEEHIILENKKYVQYQDGFHQLINYLSGFSGTQIQSDQGMKTQYVHAKMLILDSGFIIQTANFTHSSFFNNREYIFSSTDSGVLHSLETIFQKDWTHQPILFKDIHPNLLVCNINCRAVIEHLLTSAHSSIEIENQYIQDDRLESLITTKRKELGDKQVRVILADNGKRNRVQHMTKPYLHAKMMLIDKKILLLGSMNFSSNSLDNNREIGILITDKNIIKQFETQFEKDWK